MIRYFGLDHGNDRKVLSGIIGRRTLGGGGGHEVSALKHLMLVDRRWRALKKSENF